MAMGEMMACESKLSVRATSRAIMKTRPKTRIIHLLAPEIIRTEPSKFRELVQRLTGKSAAGEGEEVKETVAPPTMTRQMQEESKGRIEPEGEKMHEGWEMMERVKREVVVDESMWMARDHGDSSRLLGGLGDLDGFIEGLLEFPQESNLGSTSSCGDLFGDSPISN